MVTIFNINKQIQLTIFGVTLIGLLQRDYLTLTLQYVHKSLLKFIKLSYTR